MNPEGLINVCQAITHGEIRKVKNSRTQETGDVVSWSENKLTVRVGKENVIWDIEDCCDLT